jgi:hypothetical protein
MVYTVEAFSNISIKHIFGFLFNVGKYCSNRIVTGTIKLNETVTSPVGLQNRA